jgi:outer membrane protein assembly factor BamB
MFPDCCGSQTLGPNFPGLRGGKLSTPTVDGSVVYTLSKMGDLFCLDAATGKVKW